MPNLIAVKHNIEVAHRLFLLKGQCENIHGHSMWVTLWLKGELNEAGILGGVDFGSLKATFRNYLDTVYDHHLLLNEADPVADYVTFSDDENNTVLSADGLPGLTRCAGDPTTENIAKWIGTWCTNRVAWGHLVSAIDVQETHVNFARWER